MASPPARHPPGLPSLPLSICLPPKGGSSSFCSHFFPTWKKQSPFTPHLKKTQGNKLILLDTFIIVSRKPFTPKPCTVFCIS